MLQEIFRHEFARRAQIVAEAAAAANKAALIAAREQLELLVRRADYFEVEAM